MLVDNKEKLTFTSKSCCKNSQLYNYVSAVEQWNAEQWNTEQWH